MHAGIVTVASCLTVGCYNYMPLATPAPEPGIFVAVTLTDSGSLQLARYLGPTVSVVRGRYLGQSAEGMQLSVSSVLVGRGDELPWAGETVTLPAAAVQTLQVRRFSTGRSALLAGVGVAGVAATVAAFNLIGAGTPAGGGGLPPVPK